MLLLVRLGAMRCSSSSVGMRYTAPLSMIHTCKYVYVYVCVCVYVYISLSLYIYTLLYLLVCTWVVIYLVCRYVCTQIGV